VPIQDVEITGSLGDQGGIPCDLYTGCEPPITLQQVIAMWTDKSHPQVMMSVDSLAAFKLEIEELCSVSSCTEQQQQTQKNAVQILNTLQGLGNSSTAPYNSKLGH
jgi:hypothetical protein